MAGAVANERAQKVSYMLQQSPIGSGPNNVDWSTGMRSLSEELMNAFIFMDRGCSSRRRNMDQRRGSERKFSNYHYLKAIKKF